MAGYVKVFSSILDSTIWRQPPAIRCVWFAMMAMADRNGFVEASIGGLADRAKVPQKVCERAIQVFLSPDPESKTPDEEGRRIKVVPRGWKLINYRIYREKDPGLDETGGPGALRSRVYFIRCGDLVKIGLSTNPWARLATLRVNAPVSPVLLAHLPGTPDDARRVCDCFRRYRQGEMYVAAPELLAFAAACEASGQIPSQLPVATGSYPVATSYGSGIGSVAVERSEADLQRDLDPAGARSNGGANGFDEPRFRDGPLTGNDLQRVFGQVRCKKIGGGLPWQSVRVVGGAASSMADAVNENPEMRDDVIPTMELLFDRAKSGKAGKRSADILREPSFAFGAWCSQWTALREELHGLTPEIPSAAQPLAPGAKPWLAEEKAKERQRATDRAQQRIAQAEIDRQLAGDKAVG